MQVSKSLGQLQEQLINVVRVLGRCLQKWHAIFPGKLLAQIFRDLSIRAITLVANQDAMDAVPGVALYLLQPL